MINQEFKARGTKYQVLTNLGICCRELEGLKVMSLRTCVHRFCSVCKNLSTNLIHSWCISYRTLIGFHLSSYDIIQSKTSISFQRYRKKIFSKKDFVQDRESQINAWRRFGSEKNGFKLALKFAIRVPQNL